MSLKENITVSSITIKLTDMINYNKNNLKNSKRTGKWDKQLNYCKNYIYKKKLADHVAALYEIH